MTFIFKDWCVNTSVCCYYQYTDIIYFAVYFTSLLSHIYSLVFEIFVVKIKSYWKRLHTSSTVIGTQHEHICYSFNWFTVSDGILYNFPNEKITIRTTQFKYYLSRCIYCVQRESNLLCCKRFWLLLLSIFRWYMLHWLSTLLPCWFEMWLTKPYMRFLLMENLRNYHQAKKTYFPFITLHRYPCIWNILICILLPQK